MGAVVSAGVTFQVARVDEVQHRDGSSHVVCSDGTQIEGCMVLDATGHARKLVEYDKPFDPGYQVLVPGPLYVVALPGGQPSEFSPLIHTRLAELCGSLLAEAAGKTAIMTAVPPAGGVWDPGRGGEPPVSHRRHAVHGLAG